MEPGKTVGTSSTCRSTCRAPTTWGRQENAEAPTGEAPAEAPAEAPTLLQRRAPWGGKKIDWAPPNLGFIVGIEKPTSYGGF